MNLLRINVSGFVAVREGTRSLSCVNVTGSKISPSNRFCFYDSGIANIAEMKNEYRILVGKFGGDLGGVGST